MPTDARPAEARERAFTRWWPLALVVIAAVVSLHVRLHRPASIGPLQLAADQMKAGHLPLWDSTEGFGRPLLARGGIAAFSPTVLTLLRTPRIHVELPSAWAWPVREAFRLAVAGFGAALLVRRWGSRGMMLLAVGGGYLVCGAILAQFRDAAAEAWAWLPWCGLTIAYVLDGATPARVVLVALAFALALASGDLVAAAVVCACVGFTIAQSWQAAAMRRVPAVLFGIVLGAGLAAVVWLPWWELQRSPLVAATVKPPAQAWFVRNYQWLPTRAAARRRVDEPGFNPKSIVLLDEQAPADWAETVEWLHSHPPATQPRGFFARRGDVPIKVLDTTPGHWRLALPNEDGWIVVAQPYTPDWVGSVNVAGLYGPSTRDLLTLPADGGLIAIPTHDRGAGEVLLNYRPPAWRRGVIVSGVTAAVCCLLLGLSIASPRRRETLAAEYARENVGGLTYARPSL